METVGFFSWPYTVWWVILPDVKLSNFEAEKKGYLEFWQVLNGSLSTVAHSYYLTEFILAIFYRPLKYP